jgi:undecaprenyl-diphosphatase
LQHNKLSQHLDNPILSFDYTLFHKINHNWTNPFFDAVFPFIRESVLWVPLYLFLGIFGYVNFGRKGLYWILAAIVTVLISNYISSDIIKNMVDRPRPCSDSLLEDGARLLINRCPTSGSFTSSHATNHFALAVFVFLTLKHVAKWSVGFLIWAFVISYAQVYVGVHFPVDVIGGALLGCSIGYFTANFLIFKSGSLQTKPSG